MRKYLSGSIANNIPSAAVQNALSLQIPSLTAGEHNSPNHSPQNSPRRESSNRGFARSAPTVRNERSQSPLPTVNEGEEKPISDKLDMDADSGSKSEEEKGDAVMGEERDQVVKVSTTGLNSIMGELRSKLKK
jgi:nitric oxide reductase activation protein